MKQILRAAMRMMIPRSGPAKPPSKTVAIVVPLSSRPDLTEDEKTSLRHLRHHLGSHEIYLIAPEGVALEFDTTGLRVMCVPRRFFGSAAAHGRMLNTPAFYERFPDHKFVFFYHLDSLVFSDQLDEWCAAGVDYIGPPWIQCEDSPWVDRPRVGNGGFTLLNLDSAFQVFDKRYAKMPTAYFLDQFTQKATPGMVRILEKFESVFPFSFIVRRLLKEWRETEDPIPNNRNNDVFWSDLASYYWPGFKVASLEQGLRFAFEVSPKTCLEMNGGMMPFGCHAFARYDRAFWEPHFVPASGKAATIHRMVAPQREEYFEAATRSA